MITNQFFNGLLEMSEMCMLWLPRWFNFLFQVNPISANQRANPLNVCNGPSYGGLVGL